jgi:prepilin-type N-terminal cleavage/methylation domain-containing protein
MLDRLRRYSQRTLEPLYRSPMTFTGQVRAGICHKTLRHSFDPFGLDLRKTFSVNFSAPTVGTAAPKQSPRHAKGDRALKERHEALHLASASKTSNRSAVPSELFPRRYSIPCNHLRSTKYACRVAVRGYCLSPVTYRTLPRMIRECLSWLKFYGLPMRGGEFDETSAVSQGPWDLDPYSFRFRAMKTKGFTLIELVTACTLLLMLSTIATTSTFNFIQATANLKSQYKNIRSIMLLHDALVQAKMNYATDLALESNTADPKNVQEAKEEIQRWNLLPQQNDSADLIARLISPDTNFTDPPLALSSVPPPKSYLPTSVNGVQITDMNSLLKAYQLTDTGTITGNIVATITVGSMLDLTTGMRPTLPIIDWNSGTPQEIQF